MSLSVTTEPNGVLGRKFKVPKSLLSRSLVGDFSANQDKMKNLGSDIYLLVHLSPAKANAGIMVLLDTGILLQRF